MDFSTRHRRYLILNDLEKKSGIKKMSITRFFWENKLDLDCEEDQQTFLGRNTQRGQPKLEHKMK